GMSAPGLDLEIALEPDALHRETQRRLSTSANAHNQPLILERGYTALGQLDHLSLRGANSAGSEQQYQYDALGRMSFRGLQGDQASKVIAYTYDAAGRLIGSQHGDHAHRYAVDAAGNRLDGQQALTDNRLGQLNGTRYRYDGAGNLIERQQPNGERLTLGYDGANRLVHLIQASELGYTREASYRYDGLGRRISKTVRDTNGTTATTHYGWDGDRIVREENDSQRTTVVYEPGSFVPMLRIDEAQHSGETERRLSAFITDALGTPLRLVTPQGETLWHAQPHDWAAVTDEQGNTPQPIRFQGQWHDEESGLYYNRHRYYDPQQGRYISQDPIGLNGGTNLYGYVTNPTGMVDPLGLEGAACTNLVQRRNGSLECVEERACIGQGMAVNRDGHCQYHDNSGRYSAGLSPSTATHDNSTSGILGCAIISTALGGGEVPDEIETAGQIVNGANKIQELISDAKVVPNSKLLTLPARFGDNMNSCRETAGKQTWQIESWD
ncbi:RHS domain-containing protein, partial [Halomonas sp. ANAO-440]|uniref:RHS repeat-associated core domain-containing protein n=1 Tax=Halomonas sp. ANAO-440 TaxID=2861360 RepID=UPI001CAA6717